jgi:hypothetical protein
MDQERSASTVIGWAPIIKALVPLILVVLVILAFVYMGYSN